MLLFQKIGMAGVVTRLQICYLFQKIGMVGVVTGLQISVTCFRKSGWRE